MAKTKMVTVSINLVHAARRLQESAYWTQLPLDLRRLFEQGLAGNGQSVRK
jgi:hypothetical protein